MDTNLRDRWIIALESGKYRQGHGELRSGEGSEAKYCCLGVLCDIIDPQGWRGDGAHDLEATGASLLSATALQRVGMKHIHQCELARLNDDDRSFENIAERILELVDTTRPADQSPETLDATGVGDSGPNIAERPIGDLPPSI